MKQVKLDIGFPPYAQIHIVERGYGVSVTLQVSENVYQYLRTRLSSSLLFEKNGKYYYKTSSSRLFSEKGLSEVPDIAEKLLAGMRCVILDAKIALLQEERDTLLGLAKYNLAE